MNKNDRFWSKNAIYLIYWRSLQPSKENTQQLFITFFLFLWVVFSFLDHDSDSDCEFGSWSRGPIKSGSTTLSLILFLNCFMKSKCSVLLCLPSCGDDRPVVMMSFEHFAAGAFRSLLLFPNILSFARFSSWCFWKLRSPVCGQEADGASLQPRDTSSAGDYGEQDQATVINIRVCSSKPLLEVEGHANVNFFKIPFFTNSNECIYFWESMESMNKNRNLSQH